MSDDNQFQDEMKAIKMLQERGNSINDSHVSIAEDLSIVKEKLKNLQHGIDESDPKFQRLKSEYIESMTQDGQLEERDLTTIYQEAKELYPGTVALHDILIKEDVRIITDKLDQQILDFNNRYSLDAWDYAIACSCGLFAAMLDLFFVKSPPRPTMKFDQRVDGVFNRAVQDAFNNLIPPEISDKLSKANPIGSPDSSVWTDLIDAPPKVLSPINHRLRSLSHDPILGFIIGVLDMMNGTCTVVNEGQIKVLKSVKGPTEGNIFELLGRMLGHLLSDVNAPSPKGNRGMGLPAPFMGILRMFEGIPIGSSNFGKQIEFMYVSGYDFRQFVVSSVPMAIMEIMIRAFYVAKQSHLYSAGFGETLLDTLPTMMNPRFRIMLALAYGTSSAINAGKIYITKDILGLNYASWMGFAWNGAHALKWSLVDRHLALWSGIEDSAIQDIQSVVENIEGLSVRAANLPS